MLTWAIAWMNVNKTKRLAEDSVILLFIVAGVLDVAITLGTVHMVVELVAKAIG